MVTKIKGKASKIKDVDPKVSALETFAFYFCDVYNQVQWFPMYSRPHQWPLL